MSGKREKIKRRQRKVKAVKFAKELDNTQIKIWLKYKETYPHVQCNAEFQEKVSRQTNQNTIQTKG